MKTKTENKQPLEVKKLLVLPAAFNKKDALYIGYVNRNK